MHFFLQQTLVNVNNVWSSSMFYLHLNLSISPKTIARLWRRSWLCKLLNQKGDPS